MRKVLLGMNMSLDGYVATLEGKNDWVFANSDDELEAATLEVLRQLDTFLMGRVLFEEMAAHWPSAEGPRAAIMNSSAKVVFSNTLGNLEWENSRLATRSPAEEIARLKQQPGKTIGVAGGARFAQFLSKERLIDEYRLPIHPVALGRGKPLFADPIDLKLRDTQRFAAGVVVHTYAPT